ncbi:MAG: hypothetical protein IJ121_02110 [Eubacterium sp.]|nr:hypothetical protein [Eubacterium sp.]
MKKYLSKLLLVAAILSIVAVGVGEASAYFTTYAEASGGTTINLGDKTKIEEKMDGKDKVVTIINDANSDQPVYVRVKAFGPEGIPLSYEGSDSSWVQDGDYWYYRDANGDKALEPGETTPEFRVHIEFPEETPDAEDFNVIVVYETTLSDWDGDIITSQS